MNYIERNIRRKAYWRHDERAFEGGIDPIEYYETPTNTSNMKKYKLLRDLPGYKAGTIFSRNNELGWQPETSNGYYIFYLPSLALGENGWFEEIQEPKFTEADMESFAYFVHVRDKQKDKTLDWERVYLNEWMQQNIKS